MNDHIAVRTAALPDEQGVSNLLQASYPALMRPAYDADVLATALPAMTQANSVLLRSGTYYVAETAAQFVGCGGWSREQPGTGDITDGLGHIRHFATHPDWLGHGIGRKIYAACEQSARAAGLDLMECYSSLNAEGFYASLGFTVIEPHEVELRPGILFSSILMQRKL